MSLPNPKSKPRVLQVITHLALGGAERVAFNLMRGLADRYEFAVYAANGVDPGPVGQSMQKELESLGVKLFLGTNVPIKRGGMAFAGYWGAKAVKEFSPQIIHLHTEIPESSYATMVAMKPSLARIPLVRTIHNTIYWTPWRRLGCWCDRKMQRSFVASVSKGAQDAFEQLRTESHAGALPRSPEIIFNGVVVNGEPRPIGKLPGEKIRLIFAGRFEEQKGADLLESIIRQTRAPRPCELMIYGSGTYEPALQALAANPPAGWTIEINGPTPDLASRLPDFDLLLMPSRYEGLALLAIEAALLGLPTVATDGPGIREGFPDNYPFLARAGDAGDFARLLHGALNNPASWAKPAESAQRFAKQYFDVSVMANAYDKLYRRAMNQ